MAPDKLFQIKMNSSSVAHRSNDNALLSNGQIVQSLQIVHNAKHDPSNLFNDWQDFTQAFSRGIYNKL